MIGNPKSKKAFLSVAVILACLLGVLYIFRNQLFPPEKRNSFSLIDPEDGLPEEPDHVTEEWIAVSGAPFSVYKRKLTLTLLACEVTKERRGQPSPTFTVYDVQFDSEGTILNGYSYVHIRFLEKNESSEAVTVAPNSSRIFAGFAGKQEPAMYPLEPSMMNRTENINRRDYYHTDLGPGEDFECVMTYIIEDKYLTEEYDLYYLFYPWGWSEDVPLGDGRKKIVFDSKILLLDNIIAGKKYDPSQESNPSSQTVIPDTSQASEPPEKENLNFWVKGEEKVRYERVQNASLMEEYSVLCFEGPVYLRDYDQLRVFAELYELPIFRLCSPFDGTDPEYIIVDYSEIACVFPVPGSDRKLKIVWDHSYHGSQKYDWQYFEELKEGWSKMASRMNVSSDLIYLKIDGEDPIYRYYHGPDEYNKTPFYALEWGYQDVYFSIREIPFGDKELLATLTESVAKRTYLKSPEKEFGEGERSYSDLQPIAETVWTEIAPGEEAPFGTRATLKVDSARWATEQENESFISPIYSDLNAGNVKHIIVSLTVSNYGEEEIRADLTCLDLLDENRAYGAMVKEAFSVLNGENAAMPQVVPGGTETIRLAFGISEYSVDQETWEHLESFDFKLAYQLGTVKNMDMDGNYALLLEIE